MKNIKVFDCFTFFSELEVVKIRLNELQDVVDNFVILEMSKTHTGTDKESVFSEHIEDILLSLKPKNRHKVCYFFEDFPITVTGTWERENFQRDRLKDILFDNFSLDKHDIILISDCDEIPSQESIPCTKEWMSDGCYDSIGIPIFYHAYFLNMVSGRPTVGVRAINVEKAKNVSFQSVRNDNFARYFSSPLFGWHLTYQGGAKQVQRKCQSFTHGDDFVPSLNKFSKELTLEDAQAEIDTLKNTGYHPISGGTPWKQLTKKDFLPRCVKENWEEYKNKGMINE